MQGQQIMQSQQTNIDAPTSLANFKAYTDYWHKAIALLEGAAFATIIDKVNQLKQALAKEYKKYNLHFPNEGFLNKELDVLSSIPEDHQTKDDRNELSLLYAQLADNPDQPHETAVKYLREAIKFAKHDKGHIDNNIINLNYYLATHLVLLSNKCFHDNHLQSAKEYADEVCELATFLEQVGYDDDDDIELEFTYSQIEGLIEDLNIKQQGKQHDASQSSTVAAYSPKLYQAGPSNPVRESNDNSNDDNKDNTPGHLPVP